MNTVHLRHELAPIAPFPFTARFQNGPRRQGSASPRKTGAPLTAPGRSENVSQIRERGRMQSPKQTSPHRWLRLTRFPNQKIRPPPVDDVNNLRHHGKCQRRSLRRLIQIRRNTLFTSPEYAMIAMHRYNLRWPSFHKLRARLMQMRRPKPPCQDLIAQIRTLFAD